MAEPPNSSILKAITSPTLDSLYDSIEGRNGFDAMKKIVATNVVSRYRKVGLEVADPQNDQEDERKARTKEPTAYKFVSFTLSKESIETPTSLQIGDKTESGYLFLSVKIPFSIHRHTLTIENGTSVSLGGANEGYAIKIVETQAPIGRISKSYGDLIVDVQDLFAIACITHEMGILIIRFYVLETRLGKHEVSEQTSKSLQKLIRLAPKIPPELPVSLNDYPQGDITFDVVVQSTAPQQSDDPRAPNATSTDDRETAKKSKPREVKTDAELMLVKFPPFVFQDSAAVPLMQKDGAQEITYGINADSNCSIGTTSLCANTTAFPFVSPRPFTTPFFRPGDRRTAVETGPDIGIFGKPASFGVRRAKKRQRLDDEKSKEEQVKISSDNLTVEIKNMLNHIHEDKGIGHLEEMEEPPGLKISLRPFQRQGLAWMVAREKTQDERRTSMKLPYPWKEAKCGDRSYYYNPERKESQWTFPYRPTVNDDDDPDSKSFRGGLLCDQMGMGKTIEIISLILANPLPENAEEPTTPYYQPPRTRYVDEPFSEEQYQEDYKKWKEEEEKKKKKKKKTDGGDELEEITFTPVMKPCKTTLIVCPLAILDQWEDEIIKCVGKETLKVLKFHKANRTKKIKKIIQYDVVLTTYSTLMHEIQSDIKNQEIEKTELRENTHKLKSPIFHIPWYRIVLDEAHTIKDRQTNTARALFEIPAYSRWCVTGTPIQNKPEDIQSLFTFLRVRHWDNKSWWDRLFMQEKPDKKSEIIIRLRKFLSSIFLRRTKNMMVNGVPISPMPSRIIQTCMLQMSSIEADSYNVTHNLCKKKYDRIRQEGSELEGKTENHTLGLILQLRQKCDHQLLGNNSEAPINEERLSRFVTMYRNDKKNIRPELKNEFLRHWENNMPCQSCNETLTKGRVTVCGHYFCKSCILTDEQTGRRTEKECPVCNKKLILEEDVFKIKNLEIEKGDKDDNIETMLKNTPPNEIPPSTKTETLLQILYESRQEALARQAKPPKIIVFSQWNSTLTILEKCLQAANVDYVRFDGKMTSRERKISLERFATEPQCVVFLSTLKAGGQGLNLTSASRVVLFDPWWNPAVEEQAIDRVHRIGQSQPVIVTKFILKGTIEEKILHLQEKKRKVAESAMGSKQIRNDLIEAVFGDSSIHFEEKK